MTADEHTDTDADPPTPAVDTLPPGDAAPADEAAADAGDEAEGEADEAVADAGDEPEADAEEVGEVAEATDADAPAPPDPDAAPAAPASNKKWYVVKVQSGREESIKAAIDRRVKIEGLEEFFGQVIIPVERVTEVRKVKETKNGEKITKEKRVVKEKKKFPGYLMAEVEFNDQILYLFRETSGVGDFVGAGPGKPPAPMPDREVQVMLGTELSAKDAKDGNRKPKPPMKVKIDLEKGDKVRVRDGAFAGMEGLVSLITEPKDETETPKITVEVQIFGRPVKIENLEFWQIDKV